MKTLLLATTIALSTSLTLPAVSAETASSAVKEMTATKRAELLKKVRSQIDPVTTSSISEPEKNNFDARGVIKPNAEVTLGAGLAAKIEQLPFKDGQSFKKGEQLVLFDCAKQKADLRGAKASLSKVSSFYSSKKRLKSRGAAGAQEVREAAADVASAKANVDGLNEIIGLCKIVAPFNGRVVERHAARFEIPAANSPIMTVVDDSALELDLIVPSKWLRWVNKGSEFEFAVDELGKTFKARVERMGAKVDAVSQTIKLTGAFVQRPSSVLAGMSGTAKFNPPTN